MVKFNNASLNMWQKLQCARTSLRFSQMNTINGQSTGPTKLYWALDGLLFPR